MEIELLYFRECPHYEKAIQYVYEAMLELHISAEVKGIEVQSDADAISQKFLGSPSVRINGKDIEFPSNASHQYSLRCRLYHGKDGISGYPPKEMLLTAFSRELELKG